jgi:hypothetical protein
MTRPVVDAQVPPRKPGEGWFAYLERIAVANGWMARDATPVQDMPAAEKGRSDGDEEARRRSSAEDAV